MYTGPVDIYDVKCFQLHLLAAIENIRLGAPIVALQKAELAINSDFFGE